MDIRQIKDKQSINKTQTKDKQRTNTNQAQKGNTAKMDKKHIKKTK